ncbi:hypothetical protein SAMN05892883_4245 [Jatrophihabitans sp. GAS493]|uniref:anti-sigma factor family protein n=1 Tax=Jatrophihabitans sp. GAS493 TaxID=1907575 RepID=UPI000BB7D5B2|nr:hypothetical protein [Jatrophihabitans sp. GAS493]SOD75044.1 hypothetical protein SAMN05892883_4245 [Jatrophihabitans sp. GAS493]
MNEIHYRSLLGAYICGILDEHERDLAAMHLSTCAECRQEVAELTAVSHRLDSLRGGNEVTEPSSGEMSEMDLAQLEAEGAQLENQLILPRTLLALRSQRSRARRQRMLAVAAIAAVLVIGGGVAGAALNSHDRAPETASVAGPGSTTRTARDPVSGVSIVATLTPENGYSRVTARVTDEPGNARCELIVVSRSGEQQVVSSWAVEPGGSGSRGTQVAGSAAVPLSDVQQLQVRTLSGTHIVTVAV